MEDSKAPIPTNDLYLTVKSITPAPVLLCASPHSCACRGVAGQSMVRGIRAPTGTYTNGSGLLRRTPGIGSGPSPRAQRAGGIAHAICRRRIAGTAAAAHTCGDRRTVQSALFDGL